MKTISSAIACSFLLILSGCVTTRAQLHQERSSANTQAEESSDSTVVTRDKPSQGNSGGYAVEELKAMIASLTGRVDELEQKLSKSGENSPEFKKLQESVEELAKKIVPPAETKPSANDERDHFASGKEAYQGGKLDRAIDEFTEYLKNPNPSTQEEAIFLKGEAHFKQKSFQKAIVEFSKFEKFPKSSYAPKAHMRIAESFDGLGMKDDAKAFYTDLIDKFPKSPEAKAAKKRLSKKK